MFPPFSTIVSTKVEPILTEAESLCSLNAVGRVTKNTHTNTQICTEIYFECMVYFVSVLYSLIVYPCLVHYSIKANMYHYKRLFGPHTNECPGGYVNPNLGLN